MKYFFVGIGGSGMAPLASILLKKGNIVCGSDNEMSAATEELVKKGASVFIGHDENNISEDVDKVIVSLAIPADNPEILKAKKMNKIIVQRTEMLGELMQQKKGLAIAGTHGKTTTSCLLNWVLEKAGFNPANVIGGKSQGTDDNNITESGGDYIIVEACEHCRAFLDLKPYGAIITNIEADHLDYFKDINDIFDAFVQFVNKIDPQGFLIVNGDSEICRHVAEGINVKTIFVGFGIGNDVRITDIKVEQEGTHFSIFDAKGDKKDILVGLFGRHNVFNCACVWVMIKELGIDPKTVAKYFLSFKGAKRRLEKISTNPLVYDDYAHHPTEIQATLSTVKEMYPDKKICCVFQPHQYSRTKKFLDDFVKALSEADTVIIPNIFEARDSDEDKKNISATELVMNIKNNGVNAYVVEDFDNIAKIILEKHVLDAVVVMGAGNVWEISGKIKKYALAKTTS